MRLMHHELKLALAALLRVPGFAMTVILTLAVTLGALICIFSLNNLLLVKSLPYANADQLVVMHQSYTQDGNTQTGGQTAPGMLLWYQQQAVFEQMALVLDTSQIISSHPEQPNEPIHFVTPEYFAMLQPDMQLGRVMNADEGFDKRQTVAVLSHETWVKWFDANADIIGSKVRVSDTSYEIIGVTAQNFNTPQLNGNTANGIWLPWDFHTMQGANWGRQTGNLLGLAQLSDSYSKAQATAELAQIINDVYITTEMAQAGDTAGALLIPLKEAILGDSRQIALLLLSGVVGLLLIAITNVTNLFLSRAAQKQRTMAIQAALGAKPAQLFRSMFAESLLLCTAAGLLGLLVAGWGFILLQELAAKQLPRMTELGLDGTSLLFTAAIVTILAAIFAKLSSRVINYDQLQSQLQTSGKGSGLQISSRTRNILIATQVTLATVLLVGASAVVSQAVSTVIHPLGFNTEQLSYFRLDSPKGYEGIIQLNQLTRDIQAKLEELPQVQKTSRSLVQPIFRGRMRRDLTDRDDKRLGSFSFNQVDPNYFELLELPFAEGGTFTEQSNPNEPVNEIIMSESMARHLMPDGNALGQLFSEGDDEMYKVVGIVKDYFNPGRRSAEDDSRYYRPFAATMVYGFNLKLAPGGTLSKQQLLSELHQIDPKLRVRTLVNMPQRHKDLVYRHKLAAGLTIVLSILALVLAAAGIYGVLNYSTQMRRYELGIHLALGAKTHFLLNMVLKESLKPVIEGLIVSALLVGGIYFVASEQLVAAMPLDILTISATLIIMLGVAYLACYLPVKKVIMADPVKALRNE